MKVMEKEVTSTGARGQDITEAATLPDILSVTQQKLLLSLAEMSQLITGSWMMLTSSERITVTPHWTRGSSW